MELTIQAHSVNPVATSDDVVKPGDFCWKSISEHTGERETKTIQAGIIACPYCGRLQYLSAKAIKYSEGWKRWINDILGKWFHWQPFKRLNAKISVKTIIACAYNPKHRYTIIQNKITANTPMSGAT